MSGTSKSKTSKVKAQDLELPVPKSKEQASDAISEIGRLQRERQRLEAAMNDELALVKERYEAEAGPHNSRIQLLTKGLQIWCEVRRDELTQDGRTKTVALPAGEVRWRTTPPRVNARALETVLATLRRVGLRRFIRTKEELNKEAILLEPEAVRDVKGISISQREEFVVVPFESQLEEVI